MLDAGDLFKNNDGAAYCVPGPLLVTRGYNEIKQPFIERTLPPRIVQSALQLIPYPMIKTSIAKKESGAQKHLFPVALQEVGILDFTPVPNLLFWGISVSLEGLQRTGTTQLSLPRVPTQRRLGMFTQTQRQQEERGVSWPGMAGPLWPPTQWEGARPPGTSQASTTPISMVATTPASSASSPLHQPTT